MMYLQWLEQLSELTGFCFEFCVRKRPLGRLWTFASCIRGDMMGQEVGKQRSRVKIRCLLGVLSESHLPSFLSLCSIIAPKSVSSGSQENSTPCSRRISDSILLLSPQASMVGNPKPPWQWHGSTPSLWTLHWCLERLDGGEKQSQPGSRCFFSPYS